MGGLHRTSWVCWSEEGQKNGPTGRQGRALVELKRQVRFDGVAEGAVGPYGHDPGRVPLRTRAIFMNILGLWLTSLPRCWERSSLLNGPRRASADNVDAQRAWANFGEPATLIPPGWYLPTARTPEHSPA